MLSQDKALSCKEKVIIPLWCLISTLAGKGLGSTIDVSINNHLAAQTSWTTGMCVDLNKALLVFKFISCFLDHTDQLLSFGKTHGVILGYLQFVQLLVVETGV